MITSNNYFKEIQSVITHNLPEPLKKGHEYVVSATKEGESWSAYHKSDTVKKVIDLYLAKLNAFIQTKREEKDTHEKTSSRSRKSKVKNTETETGKHSSHITDTIDPLRKQKSSASVLVERVPEEVKFIKRFIGLTGKSKTKEQILRFINSLQKAILEKRVRKTSRYAEKILFIQDKIIEIYNSMRNKITIELKEETYNELKELAGEEKVYPSVNFIKRYISMNEKPGMKEKAKNFLKQINSAITKGKISDNDPYTAEILEIKKNLSEFTSDKNKKVFQIEKTTLNGLEGILGCACQPLGLGALPPVMNSMDFAQVQFSTIGLRGKWHELIGDPSCNFTAMVFGKPKMGKSFLCIDFAGYLARHHGKVLYVAKEEGLDLTLQNKLQETGVQHPNLFVASELPASLNNYDFIFLDSVNKLGLTSDDLTTLKRKYSSKSFVFIFQTTKDGKFRGANTFQHDVDVVIEVPEKGKAVQMGRFNQGGEMEIFSENE